MRRQSPLENAAAVSSIGVASPHWARRLIFLLGWLRTALSTNLTVFIAASFRCCGLPRVPAVAHRNNYQVLVSHLLPLYFNRVSHQPPTSSTWPAAADNRRPHRARCPRPPRAPLLPLSPTTAGPTTHAALTTAGSTALAVADYCGPHRARCCRLLRAPLRPLLPTTARPTAPVAADHRGPHCARCR